MARPQSRYVCQSCGDAVLRWEGQCRACGAWNSLVETVIREPSRGAERVRRVARRWRDAAHALADIGESGRPATDRRDRRAGPRPRRRAGARVARSCSAVSRGSASRRCCSRPRPDSSAAGPAVRSCTPPARSRPPRSGSGPDGSGCSTARPASRVSILAEHDVGQIVEAADRRGPSRSSSTRSRPRRSTSSTGRPAASGRSAASTVRLMELRQGRGRWRSSWSATSRRTARSPGRRRSSTSSTPSSTSKASGSPRCACCALEEPVRLDRGDRRLRDGRGRADRGRRPGPGVPRRSHRPAAGQRRRARRWKAAGRCSSRSRRWCRRPAYGTPVRRASGLDQNRLTLLTAVLGRRAGHRPRVARRLREPRRRPVA